MINLAGNTASTQIITKELQRCGIEIVECEAYGEVNSSVKGKLKGFTFERAWYYYIVTGFVPDWVNHIIYSDIVGKTDIRSGGDCARRNIWQHYYKDGKEVVYFTEQELEVFKSHFSDKLKDYIIVDKPEDKAKIGKAYVDLYHIDSELGLYKFVEYIKKFNISGNL